MELVMMLAALIVVFVLVWYCKRRENFDAVGLVFNKPPEWFIKPVYDPRDWLVAYSPDQLSDPGGCDTNYRGSPEELNYYSSAYRFWRF